MHCFCFFHKKSTEVSKKKRTFAEKSNLAYIIQSFK